jgi:hypothetical protein
MIFVIIIFQGKFKNFRSHRWPTSVLESFYQGFVLNKFQLRDFERGKRYDFQGFQLKLFKLVLKALYTKFSELFWDFFWTGMKALET